MKLNLGCGFDKRPGYVNIDIRPEVRPDLILDLEKRRLPFANNSVDEILAKDVLEHFSFRRVRDILKDWHRVLRPGGRLLLQVPDLEFLARNVILGGADWEQISFWVYGAQDYPQNLHKSGFTIPTLRRLPPS